MNRQSLHHVERQVLHTAMNRPSSLGDMPLSGKHFANEAHADIWGCVQTLMSAGKPIDPVSVCDYAERQRMKAVASLALDIGCDPGLYPASDPRHPAAVLVEAWRNRETKRVAAVLQSDLGAGSDGAADRAIAALMALHDDDRGWEYTAKDAVRAAFAQVEVAYQSGGQLVGIPSGLSMLDEQLGGFHDDDLIIVGARPAMGKTGFMQGAADAGARRGAVGIISAEQAHDQLGMRWLASKSNVSVGRLRAAKLEDEQWGALATAVGEVIEKPIRIFDRPGADISEVIRVARRWKHQYGIKALYVDYIQRLRIAAMAKAPKHERVGEITASLKNLARDLHIPVIALAQVSRKVDEREGQRPCMADLSDSSEIEKEADQILMLWRDKTRPFADTVDAEIIVEKNRHGNIGTVPCLWRGASTSFVDKARDKDWMLS